MKMAIQKKVMLFMLCIITLLFTVNAATQEQLTIDIDEYVDQEVRFNPLQSYEAGIWYDSDENQTIYNVTGYITVSNSNPDVPMSDIFLIFDNTKNITLPTLYSGRNGTFRLSDPSSGTLLLHIPEILPGENSTWLYIINRTEVRPPLNFTTNYSESKLLAGDNISLTDTIQNVFTNASYQLDTCIYDINITQNNMPINFSGQTMENYTFVDTSTTGADATNVTYSNNNWTQQWYALNGGCLNKGDSTYISYNITTPENIPTTTHYNMLNTTLKYKMNATISHLRLIDIKVISEASVDLEKVIVSYADAFDHGSNVTWNVTGFLSVNNNNISYLLREATTWVSVRDALGGGFTDPDTVDNDTVDGVTPLTITYNPAAIVNKSQRWSSGTWLFNYTDIPSPIAWMEANFTIDNDGIQLINRTVTQNNNDIYIKELYLIISYWLEITKNVTSIGEDKYNIKIDVHNKGNQVTPAGTIVTIYDFVPGNFTLNQSFVYSNSPWYNTTESNTSISGLHNGTLYQWALIPDNLLNTSFAQGPASNENTTWSVEYNVSGYGDYELMDVFVTGLDPQLVDGAGSTSAVIVSEVLERIRSTEGIFAAVASVLLLLGLLL